MPMSPYGMLGTPSGGGISEMLNQYIQEAIGQQPVGQYIGESEPGVNPIQGMNPEDMMLGQMPMTPGDVSGIATGMRGAAGLAGRIKAGLGFGRETLENAAPAAARNSQGLAGAMAGFGDEAIPMGGPPQAPAGPVGPPPAGPAPDFGGGNVGLGGGPQMGSQAGGSLDQILQMLPPEAASMLQQGVPLAEVLRAVLSGGV